MHANRAVALKMNQQKRGYYMCGYLNVCGQSLRELNDDGIE